MLMPVYCITADVGVFCISAQVDVSGLVLGQWMYFVLTLILIHSVTFISC